MKPGIVRPLALCVLRDGDRILVQEGYDPSKDQTFYRPLGGGIEFGEHSLQAAIRELREEIGVTVEAHDLDFLGAIENIFTYNGELGHELILLYQATLSNPTVTQCQSIAGSESDGTPIVAVRMPIAGFHSGEHRMYPSGALDLLPP